MALAVVDQVRIQLAQVDLELAVMGQVELLLQLMVQQILVLVEEVVGPLDLVLVVVVWSLFV
jgi:hypothetical protein